MLDMLFLLAPSFFLEKGRGKRERATATFFLSFFFNWREREMNHFNFVCKKLFPRRRKRERMLRSSISCTSPSFLVGEGAEVELDGALFPKKKKKGTSRGCVFFSLPHFFLIIFCFHLNKPINRRKRERKTCFSFSLSSSENDARRQCQSRQAFRVPRQDIQ